MNKRIARFIMELPDGYEWQFVNDNFLCGANPNNEILLYEIVDEALIKRELTYD